MRFIVSSSCSAAHQQISTTTSGSCLWIIIIKWLLVYVAYLQIQVQVSGSQIWNDLEARPSSNRLDLGEGTPIETKQNWLEDPMDAKFAALQDILDPDCGRVPLVTDFASWPGKGTCEKPTTKPARPAEPSGGRHQDEPASIIKNNNQKKRHRREKRFANSKLVDFGMFPSLVEVRSGFQSSSGTTYLTHVCNGVIVGKREVITETTCIQNRGPDGNAPIVGINMYRTPDKQADRPLRSVVLRISHKVCISERWRRGSAEGVKIPDDRFAVLHFRHDFHWDDYTQSACLPWGKYRFLQDQRQRSYMASYGLNGRFRVSSEELDGEHWMRMIAMSPLKDCSKLLQSKKPDEQYLWNSTTLRCAEVDPKTEPSWGYFCNDGVVSDAGSPLLTMVDNRLVLKAIAVSSRFKSKTPDCNPDVGDLSHKLGPTVVNDIFESMSKGELYDALTCKEDNLYVKRPTTTPPP